MSVIAAAPDGSFLFTHIFLLLHHEDFLVVVDPAITIVVAKEIKHAVVAALGVGKICKIHAQLL